MAVRVYWCDQYAYLYLQITPRRCLLSVVADYTSNKLQQINSHMLRSISQVNRTQRSCTNSYRKRSHYVRARSSPLGSRATQSLQTVRCVNAIVPATALWACARWTTTAISSAAASVYIAAFCSPAAAKLPLTSLQFHVQLTLLMSHMSVSICCCIYLQTFNVAFAAVMMHLFLLLVPRMAPV